MTMYQRKFNENGGYKRLVSLYQSLYLGVIYIGMSSVIARGYNLNLVYLVLIVGVLVGILLRGKLFPYTTKCETCHGRLKLSQILFLDDKNCQKCKK